MLTVYQHQIMKSAFWVNTFFQSNCQVKAMNKISYFMIIFHIDIGAGDGEVTMRLVKGIMHMKNNIFLKVFVTEYSWTMRDRLQEKQFM